MWTWGQQRHILSWIEPRPQSIQELILLQGLVHLHRVELVAAMRGQRWCHLCLQPFAGRGDGSMCTQECPSRRGKRRGDVADELLHGHIDRGVHPQSRLIYEARARLMVAERENDSEIRAIQAQLTELENRLRSRQQRREEMRETLRRLAEYNEQGNAANQSSNASQPESEP